MRKNASKSVSLKTYKNLMEVMNKAYKASYHALEENKRLGIPSPFSFKGRIYYLMPDGRIVLKRVNKKDTKIKKEKAQNKAKFMNFCDIQNRS